MYQIDAPDATGKAKVKNRRVNKLTFFLTSNRPLVNLLTKQPYMAKKPSNPAAGLSRRQRQIMDIIYRRERASAQDVLADMPDPPSNSAIRMLLRILEERGHLKHDTVRGRFIYFPARPRRSAARGAMHNLLATFFNNSAEKAIAALLDESQLSGESLDRLQQRIDQARTEESQTGESQC